jgi:hypothetical protein
VKQSVWLGMYSEASGFNQVQYKWLSGKSPTYTNWAPEEPRVTTDRCVSFYIKTYSSTSAGQWRVSNCNYRNGFFCKKRALLTNQPSTTKSVAGCPPVIKIK